MSKRTPVAIYGSGAFAREVAWLAEDCQRAGQDVEPVCFVDDDEERHGIHLNELPVYSAEETRQRFPDAQAVVAVGNPATRQKLVEQATELGFEFRTLIHPRIERSRFVDIGPGNVICAGNIFTVNIRLDAHVHVNLDCTVGHDVVMGDYTTLAPGVHVSGWVHFGKRVYVGTGAVFINGTHSAPLVVGDDAVIGAGACVVKSVPPGVTAVGVPAKPIG